jgi:hypothetical protein
MRNGVFWDVRFLQEPHCVTCQRTPFFIDLFPSSGGGKKAPVLLGPLERANLNHGTLDNFSETGSVSVLR